MHLMSFHTYTYEYNVRIFRYNFSSIFYTLTAAAAVTAVLIAALTCNGLVEPLICIHGE